MFKPRRSRKRIEDVAEEIEVRYIELLEKVS
jgi:hypothetical protein